MEERDLKLTELENQGKQHVQDKEDLEKARSELIITKEQNDSLRAKLDSMAIKVATAEANLAAKPPPTKMK